MVLQRNFAPSAKTASSLRAVSAPPSSVFSRRASAPLSGAGAGARARAPAAAKASSRAKFSLERSIAAAAAKFFPDFDPSLGRPLRGTGSAESEDVIELGAPRQVARPWRKKKAPLRPNARLYPGPQKTVKRAKTKAPSIGKGRKGEGAGRGWRRRVHARRTVVPNSRLYRPGPPRPPPPPPPPPRRPAAWLPPPSRPLDTASRAALRLAAQRQQFSRSALAHPPGQYFVPPRPTRSARSPRTPRLSQPPAQQSPPELPPLEVNSVWNSPSFQSPAVPPAVAQGRPVVYSAGGAGAGGPTSSRLVVTLPPTLESEAESPPPPPSPPLPQYQPRSLQLRSTPTTMQRHSGSPDLSDANDLSAPSEYLAEFLSAIMKRQYAEALKYCRLILQYEPHNATARGFCPLLQQKLEQQARRAASKGGRQDPNAKGAGAGDPLSQVKRCRSNGSALADRADRVVRSDRADRADRAAQRRRRLRPRCRERTRRLPRTRSPTPTAATSTETRACCTPATSRTTTRPARAATTRPR